MKKIAVATKNFLKINGIVKAISRFFNIDESQIEIYSIQVDSGVSNQPFNEETYQGAQNRVEKIMEEFPDMDFYISCEAGIENFCNNFFNVQVVCIFEKDTKEFLWGKSAGWAIPCQDIELIRKTTLDKYLREKGINSLEEVFGTSNSRKSAVAQATELALLSGKLKNN